MPGTCVKFEGATGLGDDRRRLHLLGGVGAAYWGRIIFIMLGTLAIVANSIFMDALHRIEGFGQRVATIC